MSLFVGLVLPVSIMGRFVVEKNSLRVTSPEKIRGTHDSAIGNFGIPQYGGSMAGNVVYPKDDKKGCKEFEDSGISFKSTPGALPTFVLLDRGSKFLSFFCFFSFPLHSLSSSQTISNYTWMKFYFKGKKRAPVAPICLLESWIMIFIIYVLSFCFIAAKS